MRFAVLLLLAWTAVAQNVVTGAGYVDPVPINIAPGQVLTIFVQGVGSSLTGPVVAPPGKLPITLGGISVTVEQGNDYSAPIMQVRPVSTCGNCGALTAITIQIPYEVRPACLPNIVCPVDSSAIVITRLRVSENGRPGSFVVLNIQQDRVHILTGCDNVLAQNTGNPALPCQPLVTHADGSLVTASRPAQPGEPLTAYAVGLGATTPAVPTGEPATGVARATETFTLNFNYRENAGPTRAPRPVGSPPTDPKPLYAGLTPGYAGLYQVNFVVPEPPSLRIVPGCVDPNTAKPGDILVQSNLTVSVIGDTSFDGAGICVAVPAP
ncbi:MAG TPA: hypothetical protein VFA04_04410 [Bryobacteraceae bacterium]|nr:hypothetical protein [Bryobacteraceae bacterium]